jgi:hypothetical protein
MPAQQSGIDFVAYDREGRVVLLAEAKSKHGTSEHWAARLRRNMLSHGVLPVSKFFLIATPERIYLWRQENSSPEDVPPEFTIDGAKEFQPYFRRLHQEPSDIGPEAFDLLVWTWLTDVARLGERRLKQDLSSTWLSELAGALQQARIEMNPME